MSVRAWRYPRAEEMRAALQMPLVRACPRRSSWIVSRLIKLGGRSANGTAEDKVCNVIHGVSPRAMRRLWRHTRVACHLSCARLQCHSSNASKWYVMWYITSLSLASLGADYRPHEAPHHDQSPRYMVSAPELAPAPVRGRGVRCSEVHYM